MTFRRAAGIGALVGVLAFVSLLGVQIVKVGKTGYAVPNMKTMPDGRRILAFTWDMRLLNFPATMLRRYTRLPLMRPQVLEYPDKPRPTRRGWTFAGWFVLNAAGYAALFAAAGALTRGTHRVRRAWSKHPVRGASQGAYVEPPHGELDGGTLAEE